ncbi:DUF4124 domain-containing protein [Dyella sp. 2RAB6]|uniref:DUF4124 domain-containing protein n=1 Tax=Dyella sp. 2RAB6 TaxID=3232992 RepID=UPI003F9334D0
MRRLILSLLLLSPLAALPAGAATVYKCTGADGRVTFQDRPCARAQRQDVVQLADPTPAAPAPPQQPPAGDDRDTSPPAPPSRPAEPAAPLPGLYACTRATDGKFYISRNGDPQPYLAPFGMVGMVQTPLARGGGSGASAPELNRGKVTAGLVSGNYVWVQDQCRPMSFDETCHALQGDYDDNARKLRRAFKSDRPPLERRDEELRGQLANCR